MSRDNWERLVAAVVKREQIWQLCHQDSVTTISSDFSEQILDLEDISVTPPPPVPLENSSVSKVSNNASGRRITRRLFSAWYRIRKPNDNYQDKFSEDLGIHFGQLRRFSLHELLVATKNFLNKNLIEFGFSKVYKGWLTDGSPVTVKRYRDRYRDSAESEFQNELETTSIAAGHPNVVHVLGFCITPKELLIVYPTIVNGSVASFMSRDRNEKQPPLDWPIRKQIALGAARGLAYLHYECDKKIIHRDIKAANIWLDEDFEAVVAELELSIVMDHDVTHVDTSVAGTIGHLPPEYLSSGRCSEKTDVFGYGIFLLELITGQRAFDHRRIANDEDVMLLDWVKTNFKEGKWEKFVDPVCEGNKVEEIMQLTQIALLCTERRPTMSEIVIMLEIVIMPERWEDCCNEETKDLAHSSWAISDSEISVTEILTEISDDGLSPR